VTPIRAAFRSDISIIVVVATCWILGCGGGGSSVSNQNSGAPQKLSFFRIVDGGDYPTTIQYAYGPSIIYKNGVYHVFFCSGGNIYPAFDYVRYVKSTDGGKTWTAPIDMLHGNTELGACDPSVVYYKGFYYGRGRQPCGIWFPPLCGNCTDAHAPWLLGRLSVASTAIVFYSRCVS